MMRHGISIALVLALAGCGGGIGFGTGGGLFGGGGPFGGERAAAPAPATPEAPETAVPGAPEGADGGERAEGGGLILGFAVASLGDASVPGLWMETPLVSAEGPGRVVGPDGRTVAVTLRPTGGARGTTSSLSLEAMQALGLDLAALPTVTVISDA
ncbi:MAG: hypothetical protein ACOCY0_00055 [Roseicyclus sp.]